MQIKSQSELQTVVNLCWFVLSCCTNRFLDLVAICVRISNWKLWVSLTILLFRFIASAWLLNKKCKICHRTSKLLFSKFISMSSSSVRVCRKSWEPETPVEKTLILKLLKVNNVQRVIFVLLWLNPSFRGRKNRFFFYLTELDLTYFQFIYQEDVVISDLGEFIEYLGCVPLGWSRLGFVIQDHTDHG